LPVDDRLNMPDEENITGLCDLMKASRGIKQVEIAFDRIVQFVLRVAAVTRVLAPPAMIPVLVADLGQMSQSRAQVFPEL
jgi:hypothetical protein